MKKNIKLIFIALIITILVALFIIVIIFKSNKNNKCENIDLLDVFYDINNFYDSEFYEIDLDSYNTYPIFIQLESAKEYLYSISSKDNKEYFVILKDIKESDIEVLKDFVKVKQANNDKYYDNTKVVTKNNYTYMIVSLEKNLIIEQIINKKIEC